MSRYATSQLHKLKFDLDELVNMWTGGRESARKDVCAWAFAADAAKVALLAGRICTVEGMTGVRELADAFDDFMPENE